jgi:hypothetical protein
LDHLFRQRALIIEIKVQEKKAKLHHACMIYLVIMLWNGCKYILLCVPGGLALESLLGTGLVEFSEPFR